MLQSGDPFSKTPDIHVRYVFRQLLPEEESQFEDFMDANPHEADIVAGIQQFCEEHDIHTREVFDKVWEKGKGGAQQQLLQPKLPIVKKAGTPFNPWVWSTLALLLLLLAGVFWHNRSKKSLQKEIRQKEQSISQKDSIIIVQDSIIRALQKDQEQGPPPLKSPPPQGLGCNLSPLERQKWHSRFIAEETGHITAAGGRDNQGRWQDQLSGNYKNEAEAFRLLKEKAEKAPQSMQPAEYYVLGGMSLLYRPTPSEAVRFLEQATGVLRPDYKKLLLMAYLENRQYEKAKAWVKSQDIPRSDWPNAALKCLE